MKSVRVSILESGIIQTLKIDKFSKEDFIRVKFEAHLHDENLRAILCRRFNSTKSVHRQCKRAIPPGFITKNNYSAFYNIPMAPIR
jgi:hypothetical protein